MPARVGVRQDVHVLVEPLVHPAVPRLVVADHHRPPLVAGLVIGRALVRVDHHRVFHAGARAVLQRELRERIRRPELRVELERVPRDRAGVARRGCARSGTIDHVDRHGPLAGNRRARRAPHELLRRRPREVVHHVGDEVPRRADRPARSPGPGPTSSSPTIVMTSSDSSTCDSRSRAVGGEHLLRILQHAGAADDPAAGHVDASRRTGRSCCRTPTARDRGWCPSRADRRTWRRAGYHCVGWKSVSSNRCVMRWPRPFGPPGSFVCQAISSVAFDFGGDRRRQRDARDRLIEA